MTSVPLARPAGADTPAEPGARRSALLGISLGYFMVLLDMTVLSVAEPDLARSLDTSVAGLQWVVTAYTVVFGGLLLCAGAVADRYGAHRSFRAGIALFGLGSLLCALAPNVGVLVVLRGLLGAAAAATVPASMAMIARLYPQPAARAKAVAGWAATSGAALAAGPIVGGALVDLAGWRAIFLVNVPLAGVVLGLTAGAAVRCPRGERTIDWPAQLAACAVLGLLTDALIAFGSGAVRHGLAAALATVAAGALFVVRERRSVAPVLAPAVIRTAGIRSALLAGAAVNFMMSAVLFVLPLVFQQTLRLSPVAVGLAFLPMTVPFAVNPLLTGRIVARTGPEKPVLAGLALLTVAGLALGAAVAAFGGALAAGTSYPLLVVGLLGTGFGVSLALPALATAVVTTAPPGTAGVAGGLLNAVRQVGATVGVAVAGAFVTVGQPGDSGGAAVSLILCAVCCAATAFAVRARPHRPNG
ncbi:MFS transporter [Plantactinospora sp. B5E13]|uniref:MFS transporter n=1 Tax=unclassified Plantactinospora TaxID=2631981 RepID=UPI00325DBC54